MRTHVHAVFVRFALVSIWAIAGCAGAETRLLAPAVDYRAGVRAIEIRELSDTKQLPEPTSFKNPKLQTPEERAAEARADLIEKARFSYALASAVSRRIDESRDALAAAGIAPPIVIVRTKADPGGLLADRGKFRKLPPDAPAPTVRVDGSVEGPAVTFTIAEPGATQRHVLRFEPLEGYPADAGAQLVDRVAGYLAPTERDLAGGAAIGFVRSVPGTGTAEIDVGLERRTYKITEVYDLEDGAEELRGREALERALLHRYVRIGREGEAPPPASPLWRRITAQPK